jgi:hypothetical protein
MQLETSDNLAVADVLQNTFATHTRTHAEHLAKDYIIKKPKDVGEFVSENLYLLDLLEEIPLKLKKFFGENQELSLEFFLDPEDVNWHRLQVKIQTELSVNEAMAKLNNFDEEWWIDNEERSNSKVTIRLEYVK